MNLYVKNITSLLLTIYLMTICCLDSISAEQTCITRYGGPGVCVRLRNCAYLNEYVERRPLMGIGAIATSICSFGFLSINVCCPQDTRTSVIGTTAASQPNPTDLREIKDDPKESYEPLLPPNCGYSAALHNRVVGGNPASLNAWPWMAAIAFRFGDEPDDIVVSCGGTLISSRHVVTAAHCLVYEGVTYEARLGEHNLERTDDGAHPINLAVESYVVHSGYNKTTKENDIAILRLERDVEFTKAIHPICLPIEENMRDRDFVRTYPFVAGWGATFYEGPSSDVLQEVQVPVVTNEKCETSYENKTVVIDKRILCAGYENGGKDACQGDSGGPLMLPNRTTYYLIGIVSTGTKCATAQYPGVYTRVTYFLDFIISNMK